MGFFIKLLTAFKSHQKLKLLAKISKNLTDSIFIFSFLVAF